MDINIWPLPSNDDRKAFDWYSKYAKEDIVNYGIIIPESGPVIKHYGLEDPIEIFRGTAQDIIV